MIFNRKFLKEDLRKLGMLLIGAGLLGLILQSDKVGGPEGLLLLLTGLLIWSIGLKVDDDSSPDG